MKAKPMMMLAFLAAACSAHQPPATPQAAADDAPGHEPIADTAARPEPSRPAAETLAQADLLYQSQLGATRGGRFELDRQLAELRQAKLLYQQFLERAEGNPEMEAAARKSRERIKDVQDTIDFLDPQGVPLAPTR